MFYRKQGYLAIPQTKRVIINCTSDVDQPFREPVLGFNSQKTFRTVKTSNACSYNEGWRQQPDFVRNSLQGSHNL